MGWARRFAAAALAALALLPAGAGAFGTAMGPLVGITLGQNGEHMRITRHALQCPAPATAGARVVSDGFCIEPATLDRVAGVSGSWGGVGTPDNPRGPFFAGHEWHFLGGDSDVWTPVAARAAATAYPQTRAAAVRTLEQAKALVREHIEIARDAADATVDPRTLAIVPAAVDISSCPDRIDPAATAKCRALYEFGAAMHVLQDFYAHSNWTDRADATRPLGPENVPGYGRSTPIPWMNYRSGAALPAGVVTGCLENAWQREASQCNYGAAGALHRAKHMWIQKDNGQIDPALGAGTSGRGPVNANFARAVTAAVLDTRDKWAQLHEWIDARYPGQPRRADMVWCALTRDDPVRDCQGRVVALVIDSSGSNTTTDPAGLRRTAAASVARSLTSAAEAAAAGGVPDRLVVVDFDDSASVVYPLGDPDGAGAAIAGIDSAGGTHIAGGVRTATSAIIATGPVPGRAAIVVLTDGEDSDQQALAQAIDEAAAQGIQVHQGFLSPPRVANERAHTAHEVSASVQAAIARSGGLFAAIATAADQQTFTDLVTARGLTGIDRSAAGTGGGGPLALGLTVSETLDDALDGHTWTLPGTPGAGVALTVTPAAGRAATVQVLDAGGGAASAASASPGAPVTLRFAPRAAGPVQVLVVADGPSAYTVGASADAAGAVLSPFRAALALPRSAVVARGRPRVSLTRRGRAVSVVRLGRREVWVTWPVRVGATSALRLTMTPPRGRAVTLRGKVPKGATAIVARLSSPGRRRGAWAVRLWAGRRELPPVVVRVR
ncbi:MAG: VWA domain-containing protein [Thermoleophilia bacterium]|jgi:hypothetical protein|nr:VWA domain-containing protein [Thermoleophilia bacterium]